MKYEVVFTKSFVKQVRKLSSNKQDAITETVLLLSDPQNHKKLRVHALKGSLKNVFACTAGFDLRLLFIYEKKAIIIMITAGSHDDVY